MTYSGPDYVAPGEKIKADTVNWLIDAARPSMSSPGQWRQTDNTTVFGPETDDFVPMAQVAPPSGSRPRCWDPLLSDVVDLSGTTTQKVFGARNCMVSWGRQLYNFGNLTVDQPLSGDVFAIFTRKASGGVVPEVTLSSGNFGNETDVFGLDDDFKMPLWRIGGDGTTMTLDCRGMPFMPVYN